MNYLFSSFRQELFLVMHHVIVLVPMHLVAELNQSISCSIILI
jgi:hypothetical protein